MVYILSYIIYDASADRVRRVWYTKMFRVVCDDDYDHHHHHQHHVRRMQRTGLAAHEERASALCRVRRVWMRRYLGWESCRFTEIIINQTKYSYNAGLNFNIY